MRKRSRQPLLLGTVVMLCAAGTLYGCKDFLTSASIPQGTLDATTLANKAGVEGTLIAAYRALDRTNSSPGNWGSAASNWIWGSVTSDDAYKGSEATDQPAIDPIEQYQWSAPAVEAELNDKWRQAYEGVVRSNATINLLKSVVASKPGELAAVDAKGIEGEALFLRAHYHFEAWRMWGNIPYFRETDTDFGKANLTQAEGAAEILTDLDAAIALLPTTPRNGQKGRVTQWAAKAYKGRVQVYAGQFANALATLRDVRATGPYALETSYDHVWTGFFDLENGPETILAYQASANDGQAVGDNSSWGEQLNFPHGASPFGCCGFHQPSQNLVNFFATDATTGLPAAWTNPNWNASSTNFVGGSATPVDPRLDFTVGRDGVPYKDWGVAQPTWIRDRAWGGPYNAKKSVHEKSSGAESKVGAWGNNTHLTSVNVHIFRYADMLLLLAEAEVEAGILENARTIVNEIRVRAGRKVQGPGIDRATIAVDPATTSTPWATYRIGTYTTPFADQATARTAVRYERRLELAMEGQRFFDLRRWGIADQVLNAYIQGVAGGAEKNRIGHLASTETFTTKHALYPIPPIQIELSKGGSGGGLKQNTGW